MGGVRCVVPAGCSQPFIDDTYRLSKEHARDETFCILIVEWRI